MLPGTESLTQRESLILAMANRGLTAHASGSISESRLGLSRNTWSTPTGSLIFIVGTRLRGSRLIPDLAPGSARLDVTVRAKGVGRWAIQFMHVASPGCQR